MVKKKSQKRKTKVVFKEKKPIFDVSSTKKELENLDKKRQQISKEVEKTKKGKKGFSKFAASLAGLPKKAAINKAINQKRKLLGTQAAVVRTRQQTAILKERTELEKAKSEFRAAKQSNVVNFDPFQQSDKKSKGISIDDLYK